MVTSKNSQESEKQKDKRVKSPDTNSETKWKVKLTKEQLKNCSKIDLSGIKGLSEEDHEEVKKLIKNFGFLFVLSDLDLGNTSTVKHNIKHTDYTPFQEWYCRIPPHQFEEVRNI